MSGYDNNPIPDDRFLVTYRLSGNEKEAWARARDICVEQTVEFPEKLISPGRIRDHVVGRIEFVRPLEEGALCAGISYAQDTVAGEFTTLLNVVFGNISLQKGIRVCNIDLPPALLKEFKGPRFGVEGLRAFLKAPQRPLLCTALKPMGLSARELADRAYQCALGGIDIIKDDHGLTDQCYAPFEERVALCAEAVARANQETGGGSIYVAHITASFPVMIKRARFAKKEGARGLLIIPGIAGLDAIRHISNDDTIALPLFSHPAFQGSYVINPDTGLSPSVLFGQLNRLAGADAAIFPHSGGRFSFTRKECEMVIAGAASDMGHIKPIFPCPAGGMSLDRLPDLLTFYGKDTIFLLSGGLYTHGPDFIENCSKARALLSDDKMHG
ncbi:MAG: RuBisCO large subunit C-terminal-like domain-containing protein [bacterium]